MTQPTLGHNVIRIIHKKCLAFIECKALSTGDPSAHLIDLGNPVKMVRDNS